MKTKLGYAASALMSILLCAAMLCGAVIPTLADGGALPSLDYSNPNIENTVTLSACDLYTVLLNTTPTAGEALYWQASQLNLQYTDQIPDGCIDTQYDGDRGVLDVTLLPYTYHAANGAEVTWVPHKLYLEGVGYEVVPLDGIYTAHIENCVYSGDFDMQVDYVCEIQIPREVVYALRHDAYQKGYDAHLLMEDYRQKLSVYEALVEMQNRWDAYEKWDEDYANYVIEKEIYDALKAEYDAYVEENNQYQALVDAHNQWQTYFAEQEAYPTKQQAYIDYKSYEASYKAAVDKLAMFESIFQKESRGWCMYNDITGKTVTEVLSKQDLLATSGCNPDDIYLAGDATENLRVLLKGYADLRNKKWKNDHEKYKALYTYYTQNYDALRQNFCDLYKTLKGLYENTAVSNFIGLKDKTLHYRQLVGHLFVVSTSLDQYSERNESAWRIDDKKLREVIEDIHYFPDGDWNPANTPFPATAVPFAERPAEPKEPTVELPEFVPGKAPTPVEDPGEPPAVVEDPASTPRPEEPKPIGQKPQSPTFDATTAQLLSEVESGVLKKYEQYVYAEKLTLTTRIEREISIQNLKTVTLYHPDGSVYLKLSVDYGNGIVLEPYPFAESPAYTYEWLRWIRLLPNGEIVDADVSCVTENISLYPRYNATPKVYYITWIVDGVSNTVPYYYGVTPDPRNFISQFPYETQYHRYEFSGWTPEILPVTGNATYEGTTVVSPKKFNVTWVIKNGTERITEAWEYDQIPTFTGDLSHVDAHYRYTFVGWDKTVSRVTRSVTYTAVYKKEALAIGGLNTVLEVLHGEGEITVLSAQNAVKLAQAALLASEQDKTLTVSWKDKLSVSLSGEELKAYIAAGCPTLTLQTRQDGDAVLYQFSTSATAEGTALPHFTVVFVNEEESDREAVFELQTENGWERLPNATYTANGAFVVRTMYAYYIIPAANKLCNVMQLATQAVVGDWVSLNINCVYGYKVVGAKVTDENGNEIAVNELSFQMPASAVHVVLEVERIVYRVTFLVGGEVWDYAEYFAGDEIVLPENPPKRTEGEFTYTFTGWGNVPVLATGAEEDLVFEAAFAQSQIIDDYDTGHNNDVVFTIVLPIVGGVLVLFIAFLVVRRIIRKKGGWRVVKAKMMAKKAQKQSDNPTK